MSLHFFLRLFPLQFVLADSASLAAEEMAANAKDAVSKGPNKEGVVCMAVGCHCYASSCPSKDSIASYANTTSGRENIPHPSTRAVCDMVLSYLCAFSCLLPCSQPIMCGERTVTGIRTISISRKAYEEETFRSFITRCFDFLVYDEERRQVILNADRPKLHICTCHWPRDSFMLMSTGMIQVRRDVQPATPRQLYALEEALVKQNAFDRALQHQAPIVALAEAHEQEMKKTDRLEADLAAARFFSFFFFPCLFFLFLNSFFFV